MDKAGETMGEVVSSIRRVTDIMGEISANSTSQSDGVSQISEAVSQMDQVTQQNAALVEEMAAAASSLKNQSDALVQTVSVFRLGDEGRQQRNIVSQAPSVNRTLPLSMQAGTDAMGSKTSKPSNFSQRRPALRKTQMLKANQQEDPSGVTKKQAGGGATDGWETF